MKIKNFKRWLGLLLALCLLALPLFAGLADEGEEPTAEATAIPSTPAPTAEPTPKPIETPAPTDAPEATDVVPENSADAATEVPEAETPAPEPTDGAEETDSPEEKPDAAPTAEPTDVPREPEEDAPTVDSTPKPTEEPSETPEEEEMPIALDMPLAVEMNLPITIEDGILTVTGTMTVEDLAAAIAGDESVKLVVVGKAAALSGDGFVPLPVMNSGSISGGTYTAAVENSGELSGGSFKGEVNNFGKITDGTFEGIVNNGEVQHEPIEEPDATPEPYAPKRGSITGGVFTEDSELNNYWDVSKAEINGKIRAYYASTMTDCIYGDTAEVVNTPPADAIQVKYMANGAECAASYGANVLEALMALEGAREGEAWYWYGTDPSNRTVVTDADTFGLKTLHYVQEESAAATATPAVTATAVPKATATSSPTPAPSPTPTPFPTQKITPTYTPVPTTVPWWYGGSDSYPWESALANASNGGVEEEIDFSPEEELLEYFLWDDRGGSLGILTDEVGDEAGYELIAIPTNSDALYDWEENVGLVPGEALRDGAIPTMVFVRAKGNGSKARTLTLSLAQLERMYYEQDGDVLLFRNGAATVSLNMGTLLDGNVMALAELMRSGAYSEADFAELDLAQIDFDAVERTYDFSEEELSEYLFRLTIAPAEPVGYDVYAELWLGEKMKEISLLLDGMGITLHAQTATEEAVVYYMDAEEERYLLESHRGVVPGNVDAVGGYDVTYRDGAFDVFVMHHTVTEDEFEGLCAFTGDAGTYYIGLLSANS